jgi:hypothetical protein
MIAVFLNNCYHKNYKLIVYLTRIAFISKTIKIIINNVIEKKKIKNK